MVANVVHKYVSSSGIEKIQAELTKREHDLPVKDKDFISQSILEKRYNDINGKDLNRLKDIVRLHVPSDLRLPLWMVLSGGADVMKTTPNVYNDTCERLFADGGCQPGEYDEYDDEQEMVTYCLTEDGIKTVQKVLIVVKDMRPDITYCPLLEPLVAVMLHFMDENECYACISGLLNQKDSFLEQTKFNNALTDLSLQDLFRYNNKKGYSRLKSFVMTGSDNNGDEGNDEEVDEASKTVLFPLWRNMIFGKLDFFMIVRLVDCLLVEGAKILYRIGLHLLNLFHSYSLSYQNMQFSDTQDLIATIAQYTQSLDDLTPEHLLKMSLKIKFTSKQLAKIHHDNSKLYKEQLLEYIQSDAFNKFTKQVIPINLNQVSDIMKPFLWLQVCEWLPARIQLKQPYILFSTNLNGFNLKTMYNHCEEEEQTLIILQTNNGETLGAYLSAALTERHCGHNNLSYFGTGETFIFRLTPRSICYLWDKKVARGCQHGKKSKYVFVEPAPIVEQKRRRRLSRGGSTKKSLMRRLSQRLTTTQYQRSLSTPHFSPHEKDELLRLAPMSAINLKSMDSPNGASFEAADGFSRGSRARRSLPGGDKKGKVRWNFSSVDHADDDVSVTGSSPREAPLGGDEVNHKHVEFQSDTGNNISTTENEDGGHVDECCDEAGEVFQDGNSSDPPASLFISCDNSTFIVGGGGGEGLYFDGDIQNGRSTRCDTYRNESLTFKENGDFMVTRLDVFGFK